MMNLQKDKWENTTLQELTYRVTKGTTPTSLGKSFSVSGINFIKAESITDDGIFIKEKFAYIDDETNALLKRSILKEEDLLFSIAGVIGRVAVVHQDVLPANTNQALAIISPKKEFVNPYYLKYYFSSNRFKAFIQSKTVQTAQANISLSVLSESPITFPSLSEQKRLVDLFQSIEQSIVQAEKQEQNLKLLQKVLSNGLASNPPVFGSLLSKRKTSEVSFGDIAECIEEHDKAPLENGLTRYIGLEHIESENFNLQGFGNIEDGTTFTKRFSKGDVLFGKRRAYLKKVAVADFDGICSSDILVFRAKAKMMLPELLPYYASSNAFMNRAISTSAGSLSPRTKWRDLAGFELSIPDLEIQEKIVSVFDQLSESLTLIKKQTQTLKALKQKLLNEILGE